MSIKKYRNSFFDYSENISLKKREEMTKLINNFIKYKKINDVLDVGTINNNEPTANYISKNLKNIKKINSLSIQDINDKLFKKKIKKSICEKFSEKEKKKIEADLVISTATIEHVGSFRNQKKMIENIIKLSKKFFIITTPNRLHPIEFHTKLPLIHFFKKSLHRKILLILGDSFFSKEKNLNLLTRNNFIKIFKQINFHNYKIIDIRLMFFKSNLIIIGSKLKKKI